LLSKIMSEGNFERVTAYLMELQDAVDLVAAGLALASEPVASGHSHVSALTLLGSGFERLIRCALAGAWTRDHERLPDRAEFGALGHAGDHDVLRLWQSLQQGEQTTASEPVRAILMSGATDGTAHNRALQILKSQAEPKGRYLQQYTYLGTCSDLVTPSVRLMSEALVGLYQRGRVHAYFDGVEGTDEELEEARLQAVGSMAAMASAIAGLFANGSLGAFAAQFAAILAPLATE
jgi:hypothetical protein